jgi:hypothetical protein
MKLIYENIVNVTNIIINVSLYNAIKYILLQLNTFI